MKEVRMSTKKEIKLWEFIKNNIPSSLCAIKKDNGYGHVYGICIKERNNFIDRINIFSDGIATVSENEIELFHPQYYSDIVDLITKYENQTKNEVKFTYWEDD